MRVPDVVSLYAYNSRYDRARGDLRVGVAAEVAGREPVGAPGTDLIVFKREQG